MTRGLAFLALLFLVASLPALRAQKPATNTSLDTHLVSPAELQQQIQDSTATRQKNIETLTRFLSTPMAEQAIKSVHQDPVKIRTAIPTLSDSELADLSARAAHAQHDFAAGGLSRTVLLLIILAIVVIILVSIFH